MCNRMRLLSAVCFVGGALLTFIACSSSVTPTKQIDLTDLGTRYAAAWSSQDPALLASFYADDGTLTECRPAIRGAGGGHRNC